VDAVPLDVRPLRADDWDDLVSLFGTRGDPAWCWCQYFATTGGGYVQGSRQERVRRNKPALLRQVRTSDRPLGVLARDDGEAIGWLALGPRQSYPRLAAAADTADGAASAANDEGVWSTTCFVVKVGKRRRGVSGALLAAGADTGRRPSRAVPWTWTAGTGRRAARTSITAWRRCSGVTASTRSAESARPGS
jgi:hypothetical protein